MGKSTSQKGNKSSEEARLHMWFRQLRNSREFFFLDTGIMVQRIPTQSKNVAIHHVSQNKRRTWTHCGLLPITINMKSLAPIHLIVLHFNIKSRQKVILMEKQINLFSFVKFFFSPTEIRNDLANTQYFVEHNHLLWN